MADKTAGATGIGRHQGANDRVSLEHSQKRTGTSFKR